jgi:hypothetical protein
MRNISVAMNTRVARLYAKSSEALASAKSYLRAFHPGGSASSRCLPAAVKGGRLPCRRFCSFTSRRRCGRAPHQQRNRLDLPRGENRIMLAGGKEQFPISVWLRLCLRTSRARHDYAPDRSTIELGHAPPEARQPPVSWLPQHVRRLIQTFYSSQTLNHLPERIIGSRRRSPFDHLDHHVSHEQISHERSCRVCILR